MYEPVEAMVKRYPQTAIPEKCAGRGHGRSDLRDFSGVADVVVGLRLALSRVITDQ